MTDPARYARIKELFLAAREADPEERARFLGEACDGDSELLEAVGELLTHDEMLPGAEEPPLAEAAEPRGRSDAACRKSVAPGSRLRIVRSRLTYPTLPGSSRQPPTRPAGSGRVTLSGGDKQERPVAGLPRSDVFQEPFSLEAISYSYIRAQYDLTPPAPIARRAIAPGESGRSPHTGRDS